jgi:hypothetical protein
LFAPAERFARKDQPMPLYEYFCPDNNATVKVTHSIREDLATWGQLCEKTGQGLGDTPADAPVQRLLFAPRVNAPVGDSHLKNIGFTKLVKRDQGVYENVTATKDEKRYMTAGDNSSIPNFKDKIGD